MKNFVTRFSPMFRLRRDVFDVLIMVWALGLICNAQSASAQTFFTAGPEAMGNAGRAANDAIAGHFLNPATIPFSQTYTFGSVFKQAQTNLATPENDYSLVMVDNEPDKILSGGFAWVRKRKSFPTKTVIDEDWSLSLAGKAFDTISWGVQGHRLRRSDNSGPGWTKHNMSLGTLVLPKPWFGLAFTAYDILGDDDLDMIPTLAMGTHIIIEDLIRIRADVTKPQKKNPENNGTLNLGFETVSGSGFLLRLGGIWDQVAHQRYWTGGIAWEGPKLSAAYAYQANTDVDGDNSHTFQLWLVF